MESSAARLRRNYGYDILINTFESILRKYISNLFIINYGDKWLSQVPKGVLNELAETKQILTPENYPIEDFFEELYFLNLKDILMAFNNFNLAKPFFGELNKNKFGEIMDRLNSYRRKITHAKSTFSEFDLVNLIDDIKMLCQGEQGDEIRQYLKNEAYKNAKEIPANCFEDYDVPNNLPSESYDLDGGFVGREKEIRALMNFINSGQDRIITITGAGGVGKTAIAQKVAYSFLSDQRNQFEGIIWFSAKANKLTDEGIIPLNPDITTYKKLVTDILDILDPNTLESFRQANVPIESYAVYLNTFFSTHKCLLIVDNLETIIKDIELIRFIEEIPRPSQVLITSRKGLGAFERPFPITDLPVKDAIVLFRIIAKERNREDLLRLSEPTITSFVKRVKCYPLFIKWAIGQVCLGKEVNSAFSQILDGQSEIAIFVFNDVFNLLSPNSRNILYGMIVFGDKPATSYVLMHLANLNDDQFEDAMKELTLTSFVFPEIKESETGPPITEYSMLELTRGFIESKLKDDEKTRQILNTRLYHLSEQIHDFEISHSSYFQSLISLGITTFEERIAFDYVKAAKNFYYQGNAEEAEVNFKKAAKVAPRLSYVWTEFSKFEFSRNHISEALKYAQEAIDVKPINYHAWFNLGIILSRTKNYQGAISCFVKAKELNPEHLPIYTELGRAYSFSGEHKKAETEFINALKNEKYPNYKHHIITLQSTAENYRRWAESFRIRRDLDGEIIKLEKALEVITKAVEIAKNDRLVWRSYYRICIDLGIAHAKRDGFKVGKPYLEKCVSSLDPGERGILSELDEASVAYYYLAALALREQGIDKSQFALWINQGLSVCKNPKVQADLEALKRQLIENGLITIQDSNRIDGQIRFFNISRQFGIIDSNNNTYLFFANGFRCLLPPNTFVELEVKKVSFAPIRNPRDNSKFMATDILLMSDSQ